MLGGLDEHFELLSKIKFMTLSACGTSLNAARYAERLMKSINSFNCVYSINAAEAEAKYFVSSPNGEPGVTGLIVVIQRGKTKDVRVVVTAREKKCYLYKRCECGQKSHHQNNKLGCLSELWEGECSCFDKSVYDASHSAGASGIVVPTN